MTEGVDKLISRWRKLSGDKGQWHSHWDDLARVMLPRRMGFTTTPVEGERRTDDIYDGTPMQAARGLANAIGGMMRPSGTPQIQMRADDDALNNLGESQDWLADSTDRFLNAYSSPKARYLQVSPEIDHDLVVFGTAVEFIGERKNRNGLLFQSLHLKDVTPFFSEDGDVEGMFHKRTLTARQLSDRYGEKSLSDATRQCLKDNPDKKIDCLHAVIPRKEFKAGAMMAVNLPIADLWIEIEAKHEIFTGGFHEFPFIVPRWETSSGEDFGRSPGMIALPDADTLQAMGETILISGQRAADPPLFAPNDGSFDAVNTFPGGISYYDVETAASMRGNPFFPLESGTNLPVTRDMQLDVRQQVFSAFYRNVLNLPVAGPAMTATEIIQRKEEFIREIGPMYGRYDTEKTAPEAERAFMVMLRAGGFAPIPKALQGKNVVFEYDSPVKRIRKQIEAAAARQWAAGMIELGQVKPEALDLINEDELGRFEAESLVIPHQIVNSRETVAAIREARLAAQQQQQVAANMAAAVDVAKTGAEAASKLGFTNEAA
jgi:Bacteriophage head to tail connecting protein